MRAGTVCAPQQRSEQQLLGHKAADWATALSATLAQAAAHDPWLRGFTGGDHGLVKVMLPTLSRAWFTGKTSVDHARQASLIRTMQLTVG